MNPGLINAVNATSVSADLAARLNLATCSSIARMVLPEPDLILYTLAFSSTVAGNLRLIGSVANIIMAEKSRGRHEFGFDIFYYTYA